MITIEKIKLSSSPEIRYSRSLPNGLTENCQIELTPVPDELREAASTLLPDAIEVIGLDADRWSEAQVIGLSLKWENGELNGLNISLLNKEEDGFGTLAIPQNTPHLNYERITVQMAARVKDAVVAAINYIETQPIQLDIADAIASLKSDGVSLEYAGATK